MATVSLLPVFAATLAGAGVGALAARKSKTKGALIGGGLGLAAGLVANALAGNFGAALGSGIGGAQAAAAIIPIVAAKKQGVASCNTCVKAALNAPSPQVLNVTSLGNSNSNTSYNAVAGNDSTDGKGITRDSCLECVDKHLGAARVLIAEARDGYPHAPRALVHLKKAESAASRRQLAIGHLHEAEDESQAWGSLHDAIRAARKAYQSQKAVPDFPTLADMAEGIRKSTVAEGIAA